tara:strand:- start:11 stop:589 length:579 start_codon:yes stop_codon:yes gene_type:complete
VTYHVQYPKSYDPNQKPPLLILFSPGGKGKGILGSFAEAADQAGWVAVGCDGFKNKMDEDLGRSMFEELLPHLEANVDHDPTSLYLGGMSGGAWRAYHYSVWLGRPWQGIAACGGWLGGSEYYDLNYPEKMAIAVINGDSDKNANAGVDKDSGVLEIRSYSIKAFPFSGGHTVGPTEVLLEALTWMESASSN